VHAGDIDIDDSSNASDFEEGAGGGTVGGGDLCTGGGGLFDDDPPPAEGSCDVVLVDAPCSSTGVLRRRPSLRWTLDPQQALVGLPEQQKELLAQAQVNGSVFVWVGGWGHEYNG
jgi:hypothetical protein